MSYGGVSIRYRLAGLYTGRILKGEQNRPAGPARREKIELIINLKLPRRSACASRRGCSCSLTR